MSEAMGPLTFGRKEEQIFIGREIAQHQDYSENTALLIDQEIKKIVTDNYDRARSVLTAHKGVLVSMAEELLVREVLDAGQVKRMAAGLPLDELPVAAAAVAAPSDDAVREAKERPPIMSPMPPLNKPLPQE